MNNAAHINKLCEQLFPTIKRIAKVRQSLTKDATEILILSHLVCYCDWGRVKLKQRQRQNTDGFRCELHLLTLRFINNTLQDRTVIIWWRKTQTWNKNPIMIKNCIISQYSKYLYMLNWVKLTKYYLLNYLELQNIHLPEADRITQMWSA